MPDTTYSIAPGGIANPGESGGPGFILSSAEWLTIQVYINDSLALPVNDSELRNLLGSGAPSDLSDFEQIITAYKIMNDQATTWQKTTYPAAISLASTIYNYGTNLAPTYYNAILAEANILTNDPTNPDALAALKAILDTLQKYATDSQTSAAAVKKQISDLSDSMSASRTTLIGVDGKGGLQKYYTDKYGSASADQKQLNDEIASETTALKGDQDEYNHDVIVASTSATYAWIWPFGTIAASIVAGIYGHKAVEALDRIRADEAKIGELTAAVQADANLISALQLSLNSIGGIATALVAALPLIETLEGAWGALADDLGSIASLIDTNIRDALPIIMNLGVTAAIKAWSNVAQEADTFRKNAYIQSGPGGTSEMLKWRVERLVASPAVRAARAARMAA